MSVWLCKACATCDDCDTEYNSNNTMGLMAKHCRKTGHNGQVTICYGIDAIKDNSVTINIIRPDKKTKNKK